jgi:hypothetical protein
VPLSKRASLLALTRNSVGLQPRSTILFRVFVVAGPEKFPCGISMFPEGELNKHFKINRLHCMYTMLNAILRCAVRILISVGLSYAAPRKSNPGRGWRLRHIRRLNGMFNVALTLGVCI